MYNIKHILFILILFCLIINVSVVSACGSTDLNGTILSDNSTDYIKSSTDEANLISENYNSNDSSSDLGSNTVVDNCNITADFLSNSSTVVPSGQTFNSIQKAINNAKENDIIELNGTYNSSGKSITVNKSLTFNGINGATLKKIIWNLLYSCQCYCYF